MSWDTKNQVNPILAQPEISTGAPPGSVPVNGVTVRNLTDSHPDAEFAAKLKIEAFKGKYVFNITEQKLPIAIQHIAANLRGQGQAFYNRNFVAELDGRAVGLLQLKYKGDTELEKDDHVSELGCWHGWRYRCCIMGSTDVDENSKCYLDHISVDESCRGRGVGKVLMQRAEHEARARNCSILYLYVMGDNPARHLYERQGYRITNTISCCGCLWCCLGPPGKVYEMEKTLL